MKAFAQVAEEFRAWKQELGAEVANVKAAVVTVRNLAIASVVLSLIAVLLALARG